MIDRPSFMDVNKLHRLKENCHLGAAESVETIEMAMDIRTKLKSGRCPGSYLIYGHFPTNNLRCPVAALELTSGHYFMALA